MNPNNLPPTKTYTNPFYKAREEKREEKNQQATQQNLSTIVPPQEEGKITRFKSFTLRQPTATREKNSENITLKPPRSEKVKGWLTKIDPPSLPRMPGIMSPRGKSGSIETPKIWQKEIASQTIDEGGESGEIPSKVESSEEQILPVIKSPHFTVEELKARIPDKKLPLPPITGKKPLEFKKAKPGSTTRSNLVSIVSPREKKTLSDSLHSSDPFQRCYCRRHLRDS